MRALMFRDWKTFPALTEVARPKPGPGEVLLKVTGAGACRSDVAIYDTFGKGMPGAQEPPFILGHKNARWVEKVGPDVHGVMPGDAYLVHGPIGCGQCRACSRGQDTYCETWGSGVVVPKASVTSRHSPSPPVRATMPSTTARRFQ